MEKTSVVLIFGVSIMACLVVCDGQAPAQYQEPYNDGFKFGVISGQDFAKGNYEKGFIDVVTTALGAVGGFIIGGINGLLGYSCNPNCGNNIILVGSGVGQFNPTFNTGYPLGCYNGKLIHDGNVSQGFINGSTVAFFAIFGFIQGFEAGLLQGNSGNVPVPSPLTNLLTSG